MTVETTTPAKPLSSLQAVAVLLAVVFSAITLAVYGHRADLSLDLTVLPVAFSLKASFFVLLLLSSIFGLRIAAAPSQTQGSNDMLFVIALMALVSAVVIETALSSTYSILADFNAAQPVCAVLAITLYGFAGAAVLVRMLRKYTLAAPQKAAAWVGLAAAASGSIGYSVYCPSNSPSFVLVCYGAPCLLVSCVTALVAPRYLNK